MNSYEIVGPFESHRVIVGGRRAPFLEAHPVNGGKIHLLLDSRIGVDVSVADAETVIPFIADCIAVALGYACHPGKDEEPRERVPFPRTHRAELI